MKNYSIKGTNQVFDRPHAAVKLGRVVGGVNWYLCLRTAYLVAGLAFVGLTLLVGYLDAAGITMPWMITCRVVQ